MKTPHQGFTLIELMVALAVLGILLAIGTPSFTTWIQNSRLDTTAQSLSSILKLARSEAVARQQVVTVDWNDGDVYVDADGNGGDSTNADQMIKQGINLLSDGVTPQSSTGDNFISFQASGRSNEGGTSSIGICDSRGAAEGWTININTVGRVTMTQTGVNCTP